MFLVHLFDFDVGPNGVSHLKAYLNFADTTLARTTPYNQTADSKKYEISSSGGNIFSLQSGVQLDLKLRRTEDSWSFVIFHAHSIYQDIQLSSDPAFNYSTTNTGPDASILTKLPYMTKGQYIYLSIKTNYSAEFKADVISTPYNNGGE